MNPYVILGIGVLWASSVGGSFWYGTAVGRDGEIAKQAAIQEVIDQTRKAALEGAAHAIAQIKVTNTTIRGKTETIVRENVVYRDCQHTPDGVLRVNEALTGRTQPTGNSKLPGAVAPR